jgi:hypothetical protein
VDVTCCLTGNDVSKDVVVPSSSGSSSPYVGSSYLPTDGALRHSNAHAWFLDQPRCEIVAVLGCYTELIAS